MSIQINEELFKKTTIREREIVALIAQGKRTKEIADQLSISRDTVESHRHNIITKTGFKTAPQIVIEFFRAGLLYWCVVRETWAFAERLPTA